MVAEGIEKATLRSFADAAPCVDPFAEPHESLGHVEAPQLRSVALRHE